MMVISVNETDLEEVMYWALCGLCGASIPHNRDAGRRAFSNVTKSFQKGVKMDARNADIEQARMQIAAALVRVLGHDDVARLSNNLRLIHAVAYKLHVGSGDEIDLIRDAADIARQWLEELFPRFPGMPDEAKEAALQARKEFAMNGPG